MKTINLIDLSKSDVKYELTTFPDGEPHIKLDEIDRKDSYKVLCRITNPNELYVVLQVGNILHRQDVLYDVIITYLMSMRMDRVVNFNEAFSLEIVGNLINSFEPEHVFIFECHSDRAFKIIKNSSPALLLENMQEYKDYINNLMYKGKNVVCFPDHGAQERYATAMFGIGCVDTICMKKVRDLENKGAIKSMEIEKAPDTTDIDSITIIDDLCDGGGTFCWAASILREKYGKDVKLNIFVKHMVNPVGLKKLSETFDNVYITNSYKDWSSDVSSNVHIFDVILNFC